MLSAKTANIIRSQQVTDLTDYVLAFNGIGGLGLRTDTESSNTQSNLLDPCC